MSWVLGNVAAPIILTDLIAITGIAVGLGGGLLGAVHASLSKRLDRQEARVEQVMVTVARIDAETQATGQRIDLQNGRIGKLEGQLDEAHHEWANALSTYADVVRGLQETLAEINARR